MEGEIVGVKRCGKAWVNGLFEKRQGTSSLRRGEALGEGFQVSMLSGKRKNRAWYMNIPCVE
jgi:hypothetical protein